MTAKSLRAGLATLTMSGLVLTGCNPSDQAATGGDGTPPVLRFSAIPDQNQTELREKFTAIAQHLSGELGVPFEYVPAADYRASVQMFRNGDIHLAWFGGLTGAQARNAVPGARAIAQGDSDPLYFSYFLAHRDTGLEESDEFPMEIAGMSFTFGSESSTSGRLMPEYFIREITGKTPAEFFEQQPGFSGDHTKTIELVSTGQIQVAVVAYTLYDRMVEDGLIDTDLVRVIWRTPDYANYNFTAHPELDEIYGEGFIERLAKALIAIDDPELLSAFPRGAIIPAKCEDFEGTRIVAEDLGFL